MLFFSAALCFFRLTRAGPLKKYFSSCRRIKIQNDMTKDNGFRV